ncbi:hypothetical protein GCM10027577_26670 [Spirosoma fluminis]
MPCTIPVFTNTGSQSFDFVDELLSTKSLKVCVNVHDWIKYGIDASATVYQSLIESSR